MINKLVETAKNLLGNRFTFQPAVLIPQQKINRQLEALLKGNRRIRSLRIVFQPGKATLFLSVKYVFFTDVFYQVGPVKISRQDRDFIVMLREISPLGIVSNSRFRKTVSTSVLSLLKRIPWFDPFRRKWGAGVSVTKNETLLTIRFPATVLVKLNLLTAKDLKLQKNFEPTGLRFEEQRLRIGFRLRSDDRASSG